MVLRSCTTSSSEGTVSSASRVCGPERVLVLVRSRWMSTMPATLWSALPPPEIQLAHACWLLNVLRILQPHTVPPTSMSVEPLWWRRRWCSLHSTVVPLRKSCPRFRRSTFDRWKDMPLSVVSTR